MPAASEVINENVYIVFRLGNNLPLITKSAIMFSKNALTVKLVREKYRSLADSARPKSKVLASNLASCRWQFASDDTEISFNFFRDFALYCHTTTILHVAIR